MKEKLILFIVGALLVAVTYFVTGEINAALRDNEETNRVTIELDLSFGDIVSLETGGDISRRVYIDLLKDTVFVTIWGPTPVLENIDVPASKSHIKPPYHVSE